MRHVLCLLAVGILVMVAALCFGLTEIASAIWRLAWGVVFTASAPLIGLIATAVFAVRMARGETLEESIEEMEEHTAELTRRQQVRGLARSLGALVSQ